MLGASGAIGGALAAQLRGDPCCATVLALGRASTPAVDFDAPDSIAAAADSLRTQGPWHLVLVATGMLQGPTGHPEKRLADLRAGHMAASFAVNTIGPALALAHFAPQLARGERSVLAVLSAKIGSIGDNRLGGWVSYRASKAALNMVVKTTALSWPAATRSWWLRRCTLAPWTRPCRPRFAARRSGGPPETPHATFWRCSTACSRRPAAAFGPMTASSCPGNPHND